jgi:hypothetical protein
MSKFFGLLLLVFGIILTPWFYFVVRSVPLTAVGLSVIIIGFTFYAVANAKPFVSFQAFLMLSKPRQDDISVLLQQLEVNNKAIYLPSSPNNENPKAVFSILNENMNKQQLAEKLFTHYSCTYGTNPERIALAIDNPSGINIEVLENKPGPTVKEIESALTFILIKVLDIANRVSVDSKGSEINIDIKCVKIKICDENSAFYRCFGSRIASIAATISSEALKKPIRIKEESYQKGINKIKLEILN